MALCRFAIERRGGILLIARSEIFGPVNASGGCGAPYLDAGGRFACDDEERSWSRT
jgi:hypothetical protein